jgi:trigger factor
MQVSVEKLEGLERKLTISVDSSVVDKAVDKKLAEFSKTAKIDGFRPGKIPTRVLKERFGGAARQEAMSDIIQESYQEALAETKINPVAMPSVELAESKDGEFVYTATVEVYPEIELADMSTYSVNQESVSISEEDIDGVIDKLKAQKAGWEDIEREAQEGDQITIDFVGSIDGKEFDGGKSDDAKIVIGSKSMIPGFETGLIGLKTGEASTITCEFPKKYQAEDLAGKEAEFVIKVINVEAPKMPEVDEQFIKNFGVEDGTLESFRAEVKSNMKRELDDALKNKNKKNVMDALLENNSIDAPKAMVDEEIKALKENIKQYTQQEAEFDDALFVNDASRRVRLGLIISKIIDVEKLTADEEKVKKAVDDIAAPYDDPQEVVSYYFSQPNMLKNVGAMVVEEEVVDLILSKANVTVVEKSYQDVIVAQ